VATAGARVLCRDPASGVRMSAPRSAPMPHRPVRCCLVTVEFSTDVTNSGAIWVVRVAGEVDIATAPRLASTFDAVVEAAPSQVLVELENVSFLDSSGIRVLVLAQRRLDEVGASFVIDGMSEAVKHVLEIAGVLDSLSRPSET
jgi:anti-sigma B factor antagonist